jgi:predicted membrane-bound dolichyl-phosphate-mannose-protein mannosyltransferase
MCTVAPVMVRRLVSAPRAPLVLLAIVSVLSLGARSAALGEPCQSPCNTANDHTLIFDEAYYVNAARVIAGIRPPPGAHYADAPLGTDPNAEHPQGVKLIMAASIELFGDGPFAWRLGSLIFGSIAILGMYALVRAAGGGPWSAVGAAALMACDNLLLVHGRIGTLDIYTVAAMIWGVAFYLRGWRCRAALALAVAAAFKLVAPYAVLVLALLEIARLITARRQRGMPVSWRLKPALGRFLTCTLVGLAVFMGLLWIMGEIATPYADATATLITGGPIAHLEHMISYAAQQVSPHGPQGIASYPWEWLVDFKPIVYLQINPSLPGDGLYAIHPSSLFLGMISPPIMLLAIPALGFSAYRFVRLRRGGGAAAGVARADDVQMAVLGVAWFIGTWLPFELLSAIDSRTSYIYYMVIVMPGIYVADTYLVSQAWRLGHKVVCGAILAWTLSVVAAVVVMYPFNPVF